MNVCVCPAGWRGDWHQHSEGHSRNLLRHPLRQDQTVPGRVTRQTGQRFATVSLFIFTQSISGRETGPKRERTTCNKGLKFILHFATLAGGELYVLSN